MRPWTPDSVRLPPGNWRLDPFTRVVRFVPDPMPAPRQILGCGTDAGYRRHLANDEEVCRECRVASRQYAAELRRQRAERKYAS